MSQVKRRDQIQKLHKLSLVDLKEEAIELTKKIHLQNLKIEFGKGKDVSTVRHLKKQLARTLTIARQKL